MDMVEAAGMPFDGPLLTALVSVCATDIEYVLCQGIKSEDDLLMLAAQVCKKGVRCVEPDAAERLSSGFRYVPCPPKAAIRLQLKFVHVATYNALLKCCSMSGDVAGMQHLFSLMKEQGLKPDEFTMRSIMSGQLHRQNIKGALDIVSDFRNQHGIQPTIRTYTDLMTLCKRYVTSALDVTLQAFFLVLTIQYYRMGDLETAVELMNKMKADQVEPSWSCYTALSHLYASRGDVVNASRVQQEMQEQSDLPATQANMGSLVTAVGLRLKPGEPLDEVYRLVDRIKSDRGMSPDLATFSPLITSYLKADRIDDAWAVQQAMIERYGVQPDKVLNKIFLFALEERDDVSRIEMIFDRMCQRPDTFFFHRKALSLLCLHRLQKENDPMRACEVLEELRKRNFAYKVDQRVTPALLRLIRELLWRNNCHQALNVFGFIRRQQPPPTASNFTFLFQRCVRPRHLPVLYKFRKAMQEIGIPFNVESALAYLQALCRSGRINEAVGFIHSMEREHHIPALVQHYNTVLRESMEARDTDMARRVLEVMEENSVHGDEFTDEVRRQLAASARATKTA